MNEIELYEERLNNEQHFVEVDQFSCGTYEPLNDFIKGSAFEYNRKGIGNTYLLFCDREAGTRDIVCYYTLRANFLCIKKEYIPVVEISRFAVDINYQRKGIGSSCILNVITSKVLDIKSHIGIVGILVFADTLESLKFYETIGFKDFGEMVSGKNEILTVDDGYNEGCHVLILGLGDNNLIEIENNIEKKRNLHS